MHHPFVPATALIRLCNRRQMSTRIHKVALNSFDTNANLYNAVRPSYPVEAVEAILNQVTTTKPCRILDLAAGSGIFTKLIFEHKQSANVEIFAAEPVAGMREIFTQSLPHVPIVEGFSTALPYSDDFFDVVTVAQAFHWFADKESITEIHRVLKKKTACGTAGKLALIWNLESADEEWVGKLRDLYEPYDSDVPQYRKGEWENVFRDQQLFEYPLSKQMFRQNMLVSQPEVWSRVLSKSYITALGEEEQKVLKDKVVNLVEVEYAEKFSIDRGDDRVKKCAWQPLDVEVAITTAI
jgi:ubiquinone/menaquinone biosynthesis C-methylase UbiE